MFKSYCSLLEPTSNAWARCRARVDWPTSAPENRRRRWVLDRATTLDESDQYDHDRHDEEDMNETAHGVRGDQTEQPESYHDDGDCPQHVTHLLLLQSGSLSMSQPGGSAAGVCFADHGPAQCQAARHPDHQQHRIHEDHGVQE